MGAPAANPAIAALLARAAMARIAGAQPGAGGPAVPGAGMAGEPGGGSPGGMSGMTVASPGDQQQDQLSKELSVMRVADPRMVSSKITEAKQTIVTLINHTAMSLPAVARALSKTLQGLDAGIKEAQQAGAAQQASAPVANPLQTSILPPSIGPGGSSSAGSSNSAPQPGA